MVKTDDDADGAIFIDTNILVFATIRKSPMHVPAQAALHAIAQSGARAWISRQVIREFLVYLTRPGTLPIANHCTRAADQVAELMKLYEVADETSDVTDNLLKRLRKIDSSGKHIHDANIVATMLVKGIPRLLTHNVKDFKRYSHLIKIIPFEPEP